MHFSPPLWPVFRSLILPLLRFLFPASTLRFLVASPSSPPSFGPSPLSRTFFRYIPLAPDLPHSVTTAPNITSRSVQPSPFASPSPFVFPPSLLLSIFYIPRSVLPPLPAILNPNLDPSRSRSDKFSFPPPDRFRKVIAFVSFCLSDRLSLVFLKNHESHRKKANGKSLREKGKC